MNTLAKAPLTEAERAAVAALVGSGELDRLQAARRAELSAKRRAARSRLSGLAPIEAAIAVHAAAHTAAEAEVRSARVALEVAALKARSAAHLMLANEAQRDSLRASVNRELGALADPRCADVEVWLRTLLPLVRGASRVWTEVQPRKMTLKGVFGLEDVDAMQEVVLNNAEQITAAVATIGRLSDEVTALVHDFDGDDVGPALARICAEARQAMTGLVREHELPELPV